VLTWTATWVPSGANPLSSREPPLLFVVLSLTLKVALFKGWSFAAKLSFCSVVYSSCSMEGRSQSSSISLVTIPFPALRCPRLVTIATSQTSRSQNLLRSSLPQSSAAADCGVLRSAQLGLMLVEDADWLRGRFPAACYAPRTRSSWYICIWFEGKSSHLERVEIIVVFKKFSACCWLWKLDCRKIAGGGEIRTHVGFSHCPRRTEIPSGPILPSSDVPAVQNALASMLPLMHTEIWGYFTGIVQVK
jgi:hypothetical protein